MNTHLRAPARMRAGAAALALLAGLTFGTGAASAAPVPPFNVSPTSLSYTASVGSDQSQLVSVSTGRKAVVLESPASFGPGMPAFCAASISLASCCG